MGIGAGFGTNCSALTLLAELGPAVLFSAEIPA